MGPSSQKQKIMKKKKRKTTKQVKDTYNLIGNHLKLIELNYTRECVLINKEVKIYILIYNKYTKTLNCEEY